MPWSQDIKANDCRGEEEGVALNYHQHLSTTNLKETEVNNKVSSKRGILLGSKIVVLCDMS